MATVNNQNQISIAPTRRSFFDWLRRRLFDTRMSGGAMYRIAPTRKMCAKRSGRSPN
jgi:hypothetical protein